MIANGYSSHRQNRVLAALSPAAFELLEPELRTSTYKQGSVLFEPGERVDRVYFPQSGLISLLVLTSEGGGIEASLVGRDGAVGLSATFGRHHTFTRAVTQVAGAFSSMSVRRLEKLAKDTPEIHDMVFHQTELALIEAQQGVACNAAHDALERMSRWLLQAQDQLDADMLPLTQETLSQMLGLRRTTVTLIARALQVDGAIQYRRGKISIKDRDALEKRACECYSVLHRERRQHTHAAHPSSGLRLESLHGM